MPTGGGRPAAALTDRCTSLAVLDSSGPSSYSTSAQCDPSGIPAKSPSAGLRRHQIGSACSPHVPLNAADQAFEIVNIPGSAKEARVHALPIEPPTFRLVAASNACSRRIATP